MERKTRGVGKTKLFVLLLTVGLLLPALCKAQRVALKTNLLEWATASPNLSAEFVFNRRISLDFGVAANPFTIGQYACKGVLVQPEARYWFQRPMLRHFVGINGTLARYAIDFKEKNFNGDAFALGISYGYVFVLGKHWNLETNIGGGLLYYRNRKFVDGEETPLHANNKKLVFAPLRLGVTFSYIIK